jgi:BlaI family transcriptional regulator, penicillinase repressor
MENKLYEPTDAEMEILQWIWDLEPVSVREVYERIAQKKEVGYTTVLKQIQRLTEKGVLEKTERDGQHLYRCLLPEKALKTQLTGKFAQTAFGGSALDLHALGRENTSKDELLALKKWLDEQIKPG